MMKTRQYLRVPIPTPVRIKVTERDEEFRLASIEDISWGGAFVIMKTPAPKGSRIILQFLFSDESVILELWGTVVRVRPATDGALAGVGVEFDSLDYDAQSLIQRLVDEEIRAVVLNV
ncbi:MAG TPA: PilZ domain-containing protein [bacterium]|nr:PilZ domain-containing protein [bacterium]